MSSSKKATTSKKSAIKKPTNTVKTATPRRLQAMKKVWWKPQTWARQPAPQYRKLPKARVLLASSVRKMLPIRMALLGVSIVYGLGVLLFARALSAGVDIAALSDTIRSVTSNVFEARVVELGVLFNGTNTAASTSGTIFQILFFIVCSLALIWIFRTAHAHNAVSTKAALYQGMNQIVPYTIVLFIVCLQLLPLVIGSYLYSSLIYNGIAVTASEQFVSFLVILALGYWSLRMLTSGIFATYIASLPGMTPVSALRAARDLVRSRRLQIWRKIILLPVVLAFATVVTVLPFLFVLPAAAPWVFYIASIAWLPFAHAYLYETYREMIQK